MDRDALHLLKQWPEMQAAYAGDEYVVKIRDKEIRTALTSKSLSGTTIRKVSLPQYEDHGEILKWLMLDNVPGSYPYTAGTFAFKRENEDPTRMFAGEGDAFRTNTRFKLLSSGMPAKRLSTAFDSVTLYGNDPDPRPDIYGKVGNSGVSIATLDDMKVLYGGFDLCSPTTSVSMTINGPAPSILAMFMNTAIDQNIEKFKADNGREPTDTEAAKIREWVLANVRGTVQADILKEDQGQNTCIFSHRVQPQGHGRHCPILRAPQRAQFLQRVDQRLPHRRSRRQPHQPAGVHAVSNGFTFVEAYLARGMHIDDFAPNLSFFFSNGMDPEYTVMGRVARRIWAVAMKEKYGANERSQKLKYHIQTSGRSLHAQEIQFNDIRTTLQALIAIYDNCNSLHTNAFDEAITTPTEDSVRRAMAIQLIINREWGLAKNENPSQGAFIIEELTELVEEAVLAEFETHRRARRRAGRHGNRLPAWPHPGRVHALRDAQAHRRAAHRGRQHLPQPAWRRGHGKTGTGPIDGRRKAEPAPAPAGFPCAPRGRISGTAQTPATGRDGQRQRVRDTDGRGARLLAGPDHQRAVRSRWAVPAQHVNRINGSTTEPPRTCPPGLRVRATGPEQRRGHR